MVSYKHAAQTALDVQDAVNLSGVVHSFSQAVTALWDEAHQTGKGTDWVNEHPIVTLFLDKLVALNNAGYVSYLTYPQDGYALALDEVERSAKS